MRPRSSFVTSFRKITGDIRKKAPGAMPFDNQKQGWVKGFFRQKKIAIDPEAAEYILDMAENNMRDMRAERDRLAQFLGPDTMIGLDSVEQYTYHSKEENVFTLFDKICARECPSSGDVLQCHVDQLHRGAAGRKRPSIPGHLANIVVQRLDRAGGVDHFTDLRCVDQERSDFGPALMPAPPNHRVLSVPGCAELLQGAQGRFFCGCPVDVLRFFSSLMIPSQNFAPSL